MSDTVRALDAVKVVGVVFAILGLVFALVASAFYLTTIAVAGVLGVSTETAVIIAGALWVLLAYLTNDDDFPVTTGHRRHGNPPPEVSPIKKMILLMPTRVGQTATAGAWPPFWGHRFPLGDRR